MTLLGVFVGVCFEGIKVGFASAGDDDACEALVVRYPEDIFVRAPAEIFDALAVATPRHVGGLDFLGVSGCGVEEAAPDTDLCAPADGCQAAVTDGNGGTGLVARVRMDFTVHADVPNLHLEVLAC